MGPHERKARKHCRSVLRRIEQHISIHPVGETYFAKRAGCSPYALKALREGSILTPDTLDKLVAHLKEREKTIKAETQ